MPTVRTSQRQVSRRALPGGDLRSAPTETSAGVGLAEAQVRRGEAINRVGQGLAQQGLAMLQTVKKNADEVALLDASNKLDQWELERIHDPEKGALNVRGQAAFKLPETIDSEFNEVAGVIAEGLGSDDQRKAFSRMRAQRGFNVAVSVRRHVDGEMQAYESSELKAKVENAGSLAILNAMDPRRSADAQRDGVSALQAYGKRQGLSPEAIESEVSKFLSETHDGAITQLLASGHPQEAKAWFAEAKAAGQLSGQAVTRLETMVKKGTVDAEGERLASDIWAKMGPGEGPDADQQPISLDKMEEAARTAAGTDTDAFEATRKALRTRKQATDDGRRERNAQLGDRVWGAVLQGVPEKQILAMPEVVRDPALGVKIRDYLDSARAREESRAAAREGREAARESRAWTRESRARQQTEIDGLSTYLDISTPEKLRALKPGEIKAMLPTLGFDNVRRLLADQESVQKSDASFRAAEVDRDIFNSIASAAGFRDVTKPQKADRATLLVAVNAAVAAATLKNQGKLTVEQQQAITQQTIDRKVMVKDAGWFALDAEQTAAIVKPEDRASAYVPIADVPTSIQKDAAAVLRGVTNAPITTTDEELLRKYQTRVERAWARKMMGATDAEVKATLEGK